MISDVPGGNSKFDLDFSHQASDFVRDPISSSRLGLRKLLPFRDSAGDRDTDKYNSKRR
jgi:hypothetical protein